MLLKEARATGVCQAGLPPPRSLRSSREKKKKSEAPRGTLAIYTSNKYHLESRQDQTGSHSYRHLRGGLKSQCTPVNLTQGMLNTIQSGIMAQPWGVAVTQRLFEKVGSPMPREGTQWVGYLKPFLMLYVWMPGKSVTIPRCQRQPWGRAVLDRSAVP